jgi:DNA replication protein DnaC
VEARQRLYEREGVWEQANMPARHRARLREGVAWNQEHAEAAWQTAIDGGLLALVGTRGSGKTQLSVGLAHAWVMRGRGSAWYTRADDMFDSMRREFDEDGKQGKAMAKLVRTGLLVIDELADRVDSAFETRELNRLIDKRYANQVPTVLIANLTAADFAKSIGASAMSRMQEGGRILVMDGESYRAKAAGGAA